MSDFWATEYHAIKTASPMFGNEAGERMYAPWTPQHLPAEKMSPVKGFAQTAIARGKEIEAQRYGTGLMHFDTNPPPGFRLLPPGA